jgi:hypothetical protein
MNTLYPVFYGTGSSHNQIKTDDYQSQNLFTKQILFDWLIFLFRLPLTINSKIPL